MKNLKAVLESAGIKVHRDMTMPVDLIDNVVVLAISKTFKTEQEVLQFLVTEGKQNFSFYQTVNGAIRFSCW